MVTNIIVCGSRSFNDYELLCDTLDNIIEELDKVVIISGHARGADTLGEHYAAERSLLVVVYPARWDEYGKRAGLVRNEKMLEHILKGEDALVVAFWDGQSRGTKYMIDIARQAGVRVIVVKVDGGK